MYIVTNQVKIRKNEGHKLVKRFDKTGKIEMMPGFLGLEVLQRDKLENYDEVSIVTRWESEAAFKNWTNSQEFKDSHRHEGGKPEYIISNQILYHSVEVVRNPIQSVAN